MLVPVVGHSFSVALPGSQYSERRGIRAFSSAGKIRYRAASGQASSSLAKRRLQTGSLCVFGRVGLCSVNLPYLPDDCFI